MVLRALCRECRRGHHDECLGPGDPPGPPGTPGGFECSCGCPLSVKLNLEWRAARAAYAAMLKRQPNEEGTSDTDYDDFI